MQIPLLIAAIVAIVSSNDNPAPQADSTAAVNTAVDTAVDTAASAETNHFAPVAAPAASLPAATVVETPSAGRYVQATQAIFVSQLMQQQPMEPIVLASIEPLPLMKLPAFAYVTGEPADQLVPVHTGGKDVPIQVALQTLTPEGYKVDVPPALHDVTVDWKPSATRDEAFDSIRVSKADVGIVVNTDQKLVQVMTEKQAVRVYVDPKPIQWELRTDDVRLDRAFRRWAQEAGYTLRWDADRYVLIAATTTFTGTFENAVEQVLDTPGIKLSEYPLEACVYANEPPLIRITRLGDQKEECK